MSAVHDSAICEAVTGALLVAGIPPSEARYRAAWPVQMYDAAGVESLTWLLAERLWRGEGGREDLELIAQSCWTRGKFVALAQLALTQLRPYGEGLISRDRLEQARADILAHRHEIDTIRTNTAHERALSEGRVE